ncbi:MAG: glycosyltransferase [Deltaproteobacteria bacterium]|nr:glycosyltransferase [Deltaproteobacteria bacterium]
MTCRVQFVITGMGGGGAERMLLKLLTGLDRRLFQPAVISLTADGELTSDLCRRFVEIEVPVLLLGMKRGVPDPRWVFRLARLLREKKPRLVSTWMYHADLIGGIAAYLAGQIPVVWNIRHSNLDPGSNKKTTILTARACALLSRFLPRRIICCAEEAKTVHVRLGYDESRMVVIPNGFDLAAITPVEGAGIALRQELGLSGDSLLVGLVARFDPLKDHHNFVRAAERLKNSMKEVHFVLCGNGISWDNESLAGWIDAAGLRDSFHLLGHRNDIAYLNSAFDIASSSSSGEGFSNTLGEAMACGTPCVATDVGSSAFILGETGKVVPAGAPETLAGAWQELLTLPEGQRLALGKAARRRVQENFSLDRIIGSYQTLFLDVLNRR